MLARFIDQVPAVVMISGVPKGQFQNISKRVLSNWAWKTESISKSLWML